MKHRLIFILLHSTGFQDWRRGWIAFVCNTHSFVLEVDLLLYNII